MYFVSIRTDMIHLHRFEDEPVDEPYTLLKKTKCRRFAQLEAGAYEVYRRGKIVAYIS